MPGTVDHDDRGAGLDLQEPLDIGIVDDAGLRAPRHRVMGTAILANSSHNAWKSGDGALASVGGSAPSDGARFHDRIGS